MHSEIDDEDFIVGSGNYLADRGYADPEEARTKFFLSHEIALLVAEIGLSQRASAMRVGMKQPDMSRIINGNVKDYSVWRLLKILAALGKDVRIGIENSSQENGTIVAFNADDDLYEPQALRV